MIAVLKRIFRTGIVTEPPVEAGDAMKREVERLGDEVLAILGRALTIREVDAGSCNACELEIHALNNPYYNIEGRGIKFVASPRHADMLLVTGPVTKNMENAVKIAYDCTPDPKLVVAVGDCGCTGGVFGESYASCGRVSNVIPVDVAVPGCPPTPVALMQGILTDVKRQRYSDVCARQGRRVSDSLHVPRVGPRPPLLLYLRESDTRHPWPDTPAGSSRCPSAAPSP